MADEAVAGQASRPAIQLEPLTKDDLVRVASLCPILYIEAILAILTLYACLPQAQGNIAMFDSFYDKLEPPDRRPPPDVRILRHARRFERVLDSPYTLCTKAVLAAPHDGRPAGDLVGIAIWHKPGSPVVNPKRRSVLGDEYHGDGFAWEHVDQQAYDKVWLEWDEMRTGLMAGQDHWCRGLSDHAIETKKFPDAHLPLSSRILLPHRPVPPSAQTCARSGSRASTKVPASVGFSWPKFSTSATSKTPRRRSTSKRRPRELRCTASSASSRSAGPNTSKWRGGTETGGRKNHSSSEHSDLVVTSLHRASRLQQSLDTRIKESASEQETDVHCRGPRTEGPPRN